MGRQQDFPGREIVNFYERSNIAVSNAARNSRRLKNLSKLSEIDEFLANTIRGSIIEGYGSRDVGIANHYSDYDVNIQSNLPVHKAIKILTKEMNRNQNWRIEVVLPTTTVPIIRCKYLPKMILCEVSFTNKIGVINSQLQKHLFEIQPKAVHFFHFIRIWGNICGFTFKRYQLNLLVIFFLQQCNLMPSIARVQKNLQKELVENDTSKWEVQFDPNRTIQDYGCKKMRNHKNHLTDFFAFYANFDFANYVVFLHTGKALLKEDYPYQIESGQKTRNWNLPMAVASLLTMDYNVTYNVGQDRLRSFILNCRASEQLFKNNHW